jgi:drug/metabolite transporter (DMT)-like permease
MRAAPSANGQQARAFASLALVMLFWAGNSIIARAVRFEVPPFTLAFGRWAIALLLVTPFALAALRRDWGALKHGAGVVLLLGLLGIGAFNALLYSGLQETTATNALLMQAAVPALVALLDRVVFGVRVGGLQALGIGASVLGVLAIVFQGEPAAALRLHFGRGDVLILTSVVVWSLYTVLLRLRPAIAPASLIAATFAVGVVTMAPLAAWEWLAGQQVQWSARVGGAFLYVGVLPSLVSYFIYNAAAARVGAARAGQAITLMPLFGAFLSAALLGEALQGYHFAGMAFILAGIALGALAPKGSEAGGAGGTAPLEERR